MKHKLCDVRTGKEIEIGSIRETWRGELVKVLGFTPARHTNSSGRVYIEFTSGTKGEYYPSVINASIRRVE